MSLILGVFALNFFAVVVLPWLVTLTGPGSSSHHGGEQMDEAVKLLGSFARYVRREAPHLSGELMQLAMKWAMQNGIPLDKLMQAVQEK